MLDQHLYVREKLEESQRDGHVNALRTRIDLERSSVPQRYRRSRLAPVLRIAGSSLRRGGETLESWGSHPRAEDAAR